MKRHYIYFLLLLGLLYLAFSLPFIIYTYPDGTTHIRNSFDDGLTWFIFTVPTVLATILLLIPNRVTALLGSMAYLMSFGLSIFMNLMLNNGLWDEVGLGPRAILVVMLAGVILGVVQTVKLFRKRAAKPKENSNVLDDVF